MGQICSFFISCPISEHEQNSKELKTDPMVWKFRPNWVYRRLSLLISCSRVKNGELKSAESFSDYKDIFPLKHFEDGYQLSVKYQNNSAVSLDDNAANPKP